MVTKHSKRMLSWRNLVFSQVNYKALYIHVRLFKYCAASLPLNIRPVLTKFFRVFDTIESLLS